MTTLLTFPPVQFALVFGAGYVSQLIWSGLRRAFARRHRVSPIIED